LHQYAENVFQQALEVVHSNIWIPEIVREGVPDRLASHSEIPAAVRAETVTRAIRPEDTAGSLGARKTQ